MKKNLFLALTLLCAGYVVAYRLTHDYLTETQIFTRLWYVIVPAFIFGFLYNPIDGDKEQKTILKDTDHALSIILKLLVIICLIVVVLFIIKLHNEPQQPFYRP